MGRRKFKQKQQLTSCNICELVAPKYTCPVCGTLYCSLACFKEHKEDCTVGEELKSEPVQDAVRTEQPPEDKKEEEEILEDKPLKPLTSLKWPYIPEEPSFQDALSANDPKPLQMDKYEKIASEPKLRELFKTKPELRALLQDIDVLRGPERNQALEYLLDVNDATLPPHGIESSTTHESREAFKEFAKLIHTCIGGEKKGLDWDG